MPSSVGSRRSHSRRHGGSCGSGGGDRRGQRRERSEHRDRAGRGEPRGQRPPAGTEAWAYRLLGVRLYGCCAEVAPCGGRERIVEHGSQLRGAGREGGRHGERRQRHRAEHDSHAGRHGERSAGRSHAATASSSDVTGLAAGTASDGSSQGSARSAASAASRASTRSGATRRPAAGRRSKGADGADGAQDEVRVMNLADLRGQALPHEPTAQPRRGAHGGRAGAEEEEAPGAEGSLSARSGRSEGAKSARSCRSEDARSEVSCRSVASVSVRKYLGYLSEAKSPAEVKKLVKDFVRQMVKGREMGVLRADGVVRPVLCGLTRSLDVFRIKSGGETRKVRLAEVERVVHGDAQELSDLETPLDDACATLELESAECISFKFAERKAAELFTLCMQLFIDGQKK